MIEASNCAASMLAIQDVAYGSWRLHDAVLSSCIGVWMECSCLPGALRLLWKLACTVRGSVKHVLSHVPDWMSFFEPHTKFK